MIFNSFTFLVFFIVFFQLYWILNNRLSLTIRNLFIIISSYTFYGWWDWRFLSLIIISSFADYIIGLLLAKKHDVKSRKLLLLTSILVNIGILGFFKYFNFFIDSFTNILSVFSVGVHVKTIRIILPVGISFYTFQTLSYTIDIYKKKIKPTRDIFSFFAFVSFFPQLVAGPIERAERLLPQFREKKTFNYEHCIIGLRMVLWGLFKKIVIADNFGILADTIYSTEHTISGITTLAGVLFFAFQIYADFSGYSDIAIGISRMLGFELMINFKTPYFSASFGEFWHKWHISLSTWFRDYVYIPLGGNKRKKYRVHFNIFITFLLSGLWHGANITFIIWGALHGLFLIIEKIIKIKSPRFIASIFVFIAVVMLWLPFRAENFSHLILLTKSIFFTNSYSLENIYTVIHGFSTIRFTVLSFILILFLFIEKKSGLQTISVWLSNRTRLFRFCFYYTILLTILLLGNFSVKPYFIYFQF